VTKVVAEGMTLFIAPHTVFEPYRGAFSGGGPPEELERIESFKGGLVVLPFDERSAREAALIAEELRAAGTPIPERDIFIGATSIVWGDQVVITNDEEHFRRMEPYGLSIRRP
jgi:predicted nucleic acid-binding protein